MHGWVCTVVMVTSRTESCILIPTDCLTFLFPRYFFLKKGTVFRKKYLGNRNVRQSVGIEMQDSVRLVTITTVHTHALTPTDTVHLTALKGSLACNYNDS